MKFSFFIAFATICFTFSGCNKECEFWLEGKKCETEVRLKYYGAYVGVYSGLSSEVTISVTEYAGDSKRLIVQDDFTGPFYVVLTSETEFIVPYQETTSGLFGTKHYEGAGSFSGSSLNYTVTREEDNKFASFTGSK